MWFHATVKFFKIILFWHETTTLYVYLHTCVARLVSVLCTCVIRATLGWYYTPSASLRSPCASFRKQWNSAAGQLGMAAFYAYYLFVWRGIAMGRALEFAIHRSQVQMLLEATLRSNLGQVVHTYVPLSPSSITWYRPKSGDALRLGR